jgi:hypothetical protein
LDLLTETVALGEQLGQIVFADGVTQGGLSGEDDGVVEGCHLQDRFFGIPDHPEGNRVDTDRHGVGRQRGLGAEVGHPDPLIDKLRHLVDDGQDEKDPGRFEPAETAKSQNHRLFPLVGDLDRCRYQHCDHKGGHQDLTVGSQQQVDGQADGGSQNHGCFPNLGKSQHLRHDQGRAEAEKDSFDTE